MPPLSEGDMERAATKVAITLDRLMDLAEGHTTRSLIYRWDSEYAINPITDVTDTGKRSNLGPWPT